MAEVSTENLINHDGQASFVMLSAFNSQRINAPLKLTRMSENRALPVSGLGLRVDRFVDLVPQDVIGGISHSSEVIQVCRRRFILDSGNNRDHNPRIFEDLLREHSTNKQFSKCIKRANVHLADNAIENIINHWVHAANQWAKLECIDSALFSQKIWTPWHKLPDDIVGEVVKRICSPRDILNFSASCKSWRSIAQEIISFCPYKLPITHILPKKNPLPMILQTFNETTKSRYLYSTIDRKAYDMPHLGLELGKVWIPVREGWFITTDFKLTKESKINLLSPLSNLHLALPSCSSFLFDPSDRDVFVYLNRVIVVSPNSTFYPNSSLVFALVGYVGVLHSCRIGDDKWKYDPILSYFEDVTMYKGLLCAVTCTGSLYGIKIYPDMTVTFIVNAEIQASKHYIVESLSGELLLITILKRSFNDRTIGFQVYQLLEAQGKSTERTWQEIESLHGQILFVGYNGAQCFDASLYPGMKGNCVYFTDDFGIHGMRSPGNIGVYHMEDKRIEYFSDAVSNAPYGSTAIWFSPSW
ncbi:F-box protein skip23 [Rhynchospora pubera]|uniref:F-box protein skip23 n=1 Tax=Rhynchospora pubera TaxID=906938 RepID=A0AAV8DZL1_9POAL|nr:F-box protein skip23 [Rhynchospora pubera]KAJ4807033.1 F-box protein skip23 [Rhynchospora pubera]